MKIGRFWIVLAGGLLIAGAAAAAEAETEAQTGKPACEKIFNICMKRAGAGHAAVCEDFYKTAKATGVWPATQGENGVKTDPVPCRP